MFPIALKCVDQRGEIVRPRVDKRKGWRGVRCQNVVTQRLNRTTGDNRPPIAHERGSEHVDDQPELIERGRVGIVQVQDITVI